MCENNRVSPAIEAHELVKIFRTARSGVGVRGGLRALIMPEVTEKTAVAGVSFSVAAGELLALLGPNGAGKSTTIKMLTGILTPTSGYASVSGVVPYKQRERSARNIGAVFGQRSQLWWDLPAIQSFRILRDIYEIKRSAYDERLRELDSLLELSSFWDTRVRHLSLGQRVRCDLAAALLHDPPVVFLDEPTIGMDVVVKEQVREMLRHEIEQRGRTVLMTTHDMTEVERLAERVILINHGRIIVEGTLADLRKQFGGVWRIHATIPELASGIENFERPLGTRVLSRNGSSVVFSSEDGANLTHHEALRRIIQLYDVSDIRVEESDLEEIMRAAYRYGHDVMALEGSELS